MRLARIAAISAFLICFSAGGYAAGGKNGSLAPFDTLYAKLHSAMDVKDAKAVGTMLAPGFESEDISGEVKSRAGMLEGVSKLEDDPNRKARTVVEKVVVQGKQARVIQRYRMTTIGSLNGVPNQAIDFFAVSEDTWINTAGGWKLQRTVTRQLDLSSNGRNVMRQGRAPQ